MRFLWVCLLFGACSRPIHQYSEKDLILEFAIKIEEYELKYRHQNHLLDKKFIPKPSAPIMPRSRSEDSQSHPQLEDSRL